jgi:hypothetical protein
VSPRRLLVTPGIVAPLLFAALACNDPNAPLGPGGDPGLPGVSQDPAPSQARLATMIPEFGGYFLDETGRPTVYLTDEARRPIAERALGGFLSTRGWGIADLRVRRGTFRYADLADWYRRGWASVLSIPGVVLGDVDEARNRLRFGVLDAGAADQARIVLARLGIPADAVVIETRSAIAPMATLRDRVRPLGGGLQINFFATPASIPGPSLICTLGFNVDAGGVRSFITNSHCSNVEGGTTLPTTYYQSLRSGGADNLIATEADDPEWTTQADLDCPPPFQCRYSDASRAAYATGVDAPLGGIAMIDEVTTSLDDTVHTIVGQFTIVGEGEPVVGEVVNKVGRTTGWTRGPTTATCVDVLATGTNHIRRCQTMVSALVDGGDSGSPVFFQPGSDPSVILRGILWGGSTDKSNPEFVYSPMSGIERELGPLTTY